MALHDPAQKHFASDNYAGVMPELLAAIADANGGHQPGYGADAYTERLQEVMRQHFGETAVTYPVFNGTGSNVLALQAMTSRWGGVVCAASAHINTDETGAPEKLAGLKLLTVETPDGKLTPELIDRQAWGFGDVHRAQPEVVSIAQATELGTVYTPEEVRALADHAHALGLKVHVDGARITNAAAALGLPLRAFTTDAGVDVVGFGGTKAGLLFGEAIVVMDPDAAPGIEYLRKADAQLASKMRFLSAQLVALLEGDLWLRSAERSNAMAVLLAERLTASIEAGRAPGLRLTQAVESNAVFAALPAGIAEAVRRRFRFYDWNAALDEVRWMTAWDTTEADVEAFVATIEAAFSQTS